MIYFKAKNNRDSNHWLTISDLMSGLMIIFIFIAAGFMRSALLEKERANEELKKFQEISILYQEQKEKAERELHKIKQIAETYQHNQEAIYYALKKAFPEELLAEDKLNAEIDGNTLTFIFKSSDALFDNASANLREDYKKALTLFFPKYIEAITPYQDSIQEIRIEGHTSSEWSVFPKESKYQSAKERRLYSYFENMKLSQARTNSVLNFVLTDLKGYIPERYHQWLIDHTAAVGLSFSKPILTHQGKEDLARSRRVTFRIITNADMKIQEILQEEPEIN